MRSGLAYTHGCRVDHSIFLEVELRRNTSQQQRPCNMRNDEMHTVRCWTGKARRRSSTTSAICRVARNDNAREHYGCSGRSCRRQSSTSVPYLASVEERRADAREQTSDEKKLNTRRKPLVTVAQGSRQDRLTCPYMYIGKAETCSRFGHDAAKAGQPHEPGRPCYLEPPSG